MSLLKNLKPQEDIANERDSVGGGGPLESGAYPSTITLAYLTKSSGGAIGLVLNLKTDQKRDIRSTLWMTSGTAKGCLNYFIDKDGQKQYLPGFNLANSLALLTVGKDIADLETETKVVNLYSHEAKAEVPTKVDMLTDLLGKEIIVGLIKQVVDKTQKNEATGEYIATGETREENEVDKFFRARDKMTTAEIRAQATEPAFYEVWTAKWEGNTRNKSKAGATGNGGAPGVKAPAAAGTKKPTTSLFA